MAYGVIFNISAKNIYVNSLVFLIPIFIWEFIEINVTTAKFESTASLLNMV